MTSPSIRPEKIEELIGELRDEAIFDPVRQHAADALATFQITVAELRKQLDDAECVAKQFQGSAREAEELHKENDGLRKAVERLGSSEAFTLSHNIPDNALGKELLARIDFARAFLTAQEESDNG